MDFITTPTSWLTTIFVKPLYIARVLWNFIPFIVRCRESVCKPRVVDFMKALRTAPDTANLKIGVAGYCWGGLHAVKLAHDTPSSRIQRYGSETGELKPLVDAVFTAHPSMLSIPADVENVTVPLSIAIGDVDFALKISKVERAKTILKKKSDDHEVVIYPGGKHGFAIRGNPKDPKQKELAVQAEEQALSWFSKWLV
jgi:dienelactone hydrolase